MTIKSYDAWKTRSDLDDADRRDGPVRRCEFCSQPLPNLRWAIWSTDDVMLFFCDECGEQEGLAGRGDRA